MVEALLDDLGVLELRLLLSRLELLLLSKLELLLSRLDVRRSFRTRGWRVVDLRMSIVLLGWKLPVRVTAITRRRWVVSGILHVRVRRRRVRCITRQLLLLWVRLDLRRKVEAEWIVLLLLAHLPLRLLKLLRLLELVLLLLLLLLNLGTLRLVILRLVLRLWWHHIVGWDPDPLVAIIHVVLELWM